MSKGAILLLVVLALTTCTGEQTGNSESEGGKVPN